MKHYGLTIAEGSEITNPTVATGTSFPGNESTGELFFRTDTDTLYVWDGTQWDSAGGGASAAGSDREIQFNDSGSFGGSSALVLESDGTLNVAGTTDYEDLVTSDDDIPNKKYVDDAIANSPEYSTQNILYQYTATSGQTTFTGTDNNGKTLTYSDASELMVFKTGTLLDPTDYTATNGTDVVLDMGAEAGAEINIMRFVSVERYDTLQTFRYLMDTGETTASGTDAKGNTLTYAVGLINVFLNGGKLSEDQYTATDGTSIVLDDALPDDNNILEVQTFSTFTSIDEVVARANMIINPNMDVWQRNTSVTSVANSAFVADRWQFTASGAGVFDMSRSTDAPVGSEYSLDLTVTTADASIGSTDYYGFLQTIEGNNIRDLKMGTSSAQSITLSFYVKSSVTGTYTVCFRNKNAGASYRSYVAEYTISTADTWERVVITLDGDTSGTWNSDESGGLEIFFWMAAGSAFHTTAGSWATGNLISSANQVNAVGTVSNSFKVTQVRCEVGSVAAGFRSRSIGEELALCQRYFNRVNSANGVSKMAGQAFNTTYGAVLYDPPVHMRGVPTVSASLSSSCLLSSSGGCSNFSSLGTISADNDSILVRINTTGSPNTLVAGNATSLYFGSTSDYLDFDAEL